MSAIAQHKGASDAPPRTPTRREAFRYWLHLGCISFGGPVGQIAIMHRELVDDRRWISESRFLHALNYCMVLPGPEAQQLATYIGWRMHGTWGGIVAGGLFVLPSLVILVALSWLYMAYGDVAIVAGKTGPILLSIFTYENADTGWTADNEGELTIARLAKAVVDAWSPAGIDGKNLVPGLGLRPIQSNSTASPSKSAATPSK